MLVSPPSQLRLSLFRYSTAPLPAIPRIVLDASASSSYLLGSLPAVAAVQAHAHAPSTRRAREAAMLEFEGWLLGRASGVSAHSCTPEHVLIYMERHWVSTHRGRAAGGRPSPSSVLTHLSLLSGGFELYGRKGPWTEDTPRGNPCESTDVRLYRRGYGRQAGAGGYQERSARPLSYDKFAQLCRYLLNAAPSTAGIEEACLYRDLLCYQFMWHTTTRGHDCGRLRLSDLRDPANSSSAYSRYPLPLPLLGTPLTAFPTLVVSQLGTKTYQGRRAPARDLAPAPVTSQCFVRCLAVYLKLCSEGGWAVGDWLFRPLRADRRGFEERAMSTSDLNYRLRRHLEQAGLGEGETCHSFRRGSLQHARATGAGLDALLQLAQMRSVGTLRRYLDPDRHLEPSAVEAE